MNDQNRWGGKTEDARVDLKAKPVDIEALERKLKWYKQFGPSCTAIIASLKKQISEAKAAARAKVGTEESAAGDDNAKGESEPGIDWDRLMQHGGELETEQGTIKFVAGLDNMIKYFEEERPDMDIAPLKDLKIEKLNEENKSLKMTIISMWADAAERFIKECKQWSKALRMCAPGDTFKGMIEAVGDAADTAYEVQAEMAGMLYELDQGDEQADDPGEQTDI